MNELIHFLKPLLDSLDPIVVSWAILGALSFALAPPKRSLGERIVQFFTGTTLSVATTAVLLKMAPTLLGAFGITLAYELSPAAVAYVTGLLGWYAKERLVDYFQRKFLSAP